jgi:hypothetical protein
MCYNIRLNILLHNSFYNNIVCKSVIVAHQRVMKMYKGNGILASRLTGPRDGLNAVENITKYQLGPEL